MLALGLASCQKILQDFEFEDKDPKLVVQARFDADSTAKVFVTRSLDMYDKRQIKTIAEATANLVDEEGNKTALNSDSSGWYSIAEEHLTPGESYTLEVEKEGFPTASSTFHVPEVPEVLKVDTTKVKEPQGQWSPPSVRGKFTIHISDNPDTEDYYLVELKKEIPMMIWDDFGSMIIDTVYRYDNMEITSSSPYVDYAYNTWSGYTGSSTDEGNYGKVLLISDRLFNGKQDVSFEIMFFPVLDELKLMAEQPEDEYVDLYIRAVDKHLYEYARTKAEIYKVEDNPLAEPVTPYSSVEGGYGLVYGETSLMYPVDITGLFTEKDYYGGYYY